MSSWITEAGGVPLEEAKVRKLNRGFNCVPNIVVKWASMRYVRRRNTYASFKIYYTADLDHAPLRCERKFTFLNSFNVGTFHHYYFAVSEGESNLVRINSGGRHVS